MFSYILFKYLNDFLALAVDTKSAYFMDKNKKLNINFC